MNQKRSRNNNKSLLHWKNSKVTSPSQDDDLSSNIPQITPLHQPLWFWRQHSRWSHFNRGLFWGGLISLTSICSAMAGVALTTIDVVEQQISTRLHKTGGAVSTESQILTTPLQILLVEVKPDADALLGFSKTSKGKSKNILLLEVEPERNFARAINIPKDSQVQIPGSGVVTVAEAYRLGGVDLLSESIDRSIDNIAIDRYLRTSSEVFEQLTDSGKINLPNCDSRLKDCLDRSEQVIRQRTAFKTIRQRLNIPGYLANFKTAIAETEPQLDTNISMPELISVINFIKQLEPDRLTVDLLPEDTIKAGENIDRLRNSSEQSANQKIDLGHRLLRRKTTE